MLSRDNVINWANGYDLLTYPDKVYRELLLYIHNHAEKFIVLRAWKTGSLRQQEQRVIYTDKTGTRYGVTARWDNHTPVGKHNWEYINEHIDDIVSKIPIEFPTTEPEIVKYLRNRKGFGFIWTLFVMHCVYPDIYPLYDQHVYRAYIYVTTNGKELPRIASNQWSDYLHFRNFFNEEKTLTGLESIILDRGLWTYGKSLKQKHMPSKMPQQISTDLAETYDDDYHHMFTLGKPKPFDWTFDGNELRILRTFDGKTDPVLTTFSTYELDILQAFMRERNEFVPLDNNVANMQEIVPNIKMGIGRFIMQKLNRKNVDAQASSQLVALFTVAGVWEWNGLRNGMQFRYINGIDFVKQLERLFI